MLNLYQSNRLEDLAAMMHKVQQSRPLPQALAAEEVMVQSQGMRRFVARYLAQQDGIAANIRFSLPAGFAWRLMRDLLPGIPELSPFDTEVMRWRLLGLFVSDGLNAPELASAKQVLSGYLAGGETAAYRLAGQIADIFDQYLVYRPDWIDAWQRGKPIGLGGDEAWQAELWRFLDDGRQSAPHRVEMRRRLSAALAAPPAGVLPERLCVFGIATLAPMYLQLLQELAQHCEVHIFALNPSAEYWGNIIEPAQMLENPEYDPAAAGHPLLASLGKQGRDFFNALADSELAADLSVYRDEALSDGLLHRLQYGLQTLALPDGSARADDSIRIVAAHSPLRELQILKEHLLALLAEHPDWQPHDIAVLTPDIEPYAPYLEAVFGRESPQPLPYSVSDVKLGRRRPLLAALEQLVDIFDSRFEADKIFALLENETVLARFGLTLEDLPLLRDTAERLNIRWGADETMRGGGSALFTWQQGLDRIALGWMLPDNGSLWQGVSPWHADPGHTAVYARFAAFIGRLKHWHAIWQQPADIAGWAERIRSLAEDICEPAEADRAAAQQLAQALARWQQEAALAGFIGELSGSVASLHLSNFLGSRSDAGFLRGGITFCGMVPMRSLPFKVLCLIGLNDGKFPRDTRAAAFDLIARHPRKGDRARRVDDRYLFLEALISAREHLYLSYVGRDIRTNEALAPSALVGELADCLADMTGQSVEELNAALVENHPLQAFSTRYFDGGRLSSTRADYAAALSAPPAKPAPFCGTESENADGGADIPSEVGHAAFLDFWRNPVKHWLSHTLDWQAPYLGGAWETAEPFEPPRPRDIAAAYLDARLNRCDFADTAQVLEARSLLPAGEIGTLWRERCETAAKSLDSDLIASPPLPAAPYTFISDGLTLYGSLDSLHRDGRIRFLDHAPNAPEKTVLLLEHLIYNAVRPDSAADLRSHWVQPDQITTLPPIPQQQARTLLAAWLAWWRTGQSRPLPFFAKTTLAAAEALLPDGKKTEEELRLSAYKAAATAYFGGKKSTGQCDYAEVAQVFGRDDTPPVDSELFWLLAENLAAPLLAALSDTKEAV